MHVSLVNIILRYWSAESWCVVWRYLKTRSCHKRQHDFFEILLLWASSAISALWGRHQSNMADITESALRIKYLMHFFQRLCTTIKTCWIEIINLGYNARFFATHTKAISTLNLTTKWKNIPDLGTKIWWTLHFEREIYFNTRDAYLPF